MKKYIQCSECLQSILLDIRYHKENYKCLYCQRKKYKCNEDYFAIPTLENSYWAGFIAADGNINDRGKTKYLKITLAIKDKLHLKNFKKVIQFTGPIKDGISKCNKLNFENSTIGITSNKICNDLANIFNIHPRKSLNLEFPSNLTFEQSLAFIKGYIDGDGTICFNKNNHIRLSILGTESFLNSVCKIFEEIKVKCNVNIHKNIFCIQLSGRKAKIILDKLNAIVDIKLERKWKLVENYNPIFKNDFWSEKEHQILLEERAKKTSYKKISLLLTKRSINAIMTYTQKHFL